MPKSQKQAKSRHTPLTTSQATDALLQTCGVIACREDLKPAEAERVRDAFALVERDSAENVPQGLAREHRYQECLKRARKKGGWAMVLVFSVGLGQSKLAAMKDIDRLFLPTEFSKHQNHYQTDVIEGLVQKFLIKGSFGLHNLKQLNNF